MVAVAVARTAPAGLAAVVEVGFELGSGSALVAAASTSGKVAPVAGLWPGFGVAPVAAAALVVLGPVAAQPAAPVGLAVVADSDSDLEIVDAAYFHH